MKRLIEHIIFAVALLAIFTGCQDEELYTSKDRVKEGVPVQVSLGFKVDVNKLLTRAAQEDKYEYWLDNIYVLIFDGEGNRIKTTDDNGNPRAFFQAGEEGGAFNPSNGGTEVKGNLSFKTVTANDARIVGVANLHTATSSTAYSIAKEDLDKVETLADLQAMVISIEDTEPIERGGLFMMTGYAEDENGNNEITISGAEGGVTNLNCTLKLRRVDAKVEVRMTAEAGNTSWKHFSFRPNQWQVMRVPKQSLVLPAEKENEKGNWDAEGEYVNTQAREFEELVRVDNNNEHLYAGGNFIFYMPENRKTPKEAIPSASDGSYALRDEMNSIPTDGNTNGKPGQEYKNTDFKYANDDATYLVLTGHLSYTDEKGKEVNADTRYIIHLGYADTPKDVNDYNTRRNGHYVYNIKVKGVHDIEVEVNNKNEDRPGHEGDIVFSSNQIFQLDSHYDRELIEIKKSDITDDMTWSVKTPFSSGIYVPGTEIADDLKDYKWIKFAINKLYGQVESKFVKYPGDLNYNDPDITDGPDDNAPSPSFPGYPEARLMDIHQLINYLKEHKDDASLYDGDHICITAFVDENLYFINPLTGESDANHRSLWKSSVEKEDRQLHIITEEAKYSPDGNSSIVNSLYTFTQKAIRTVFNVNKETLITAWGLESVMETSRLVPGDVSKGTSTRNGRENTLQWLENKRWKEVINTSDHYGLNDGYQTAAYACLLRNRDLDGDGVIDGREVRWYLAAIDQLTDIYLGEYALDESSRLYPTNAADRPGGNSVYWHYTSSSANGSDPWVLWAEEGASRGSYTGDYGSLKLNGDKYSYRCVRNLGLALEHPEEVPADLVAVNGNQIDLSNMNPKSLRSNYEITTLPPHNEREPNNRPYVKFEVDGDISPSPNVSGKDGSKGRWGWLGNSHGEIDLIWNNLYQWEWFQNSTPCPKGYRVPNQRELLIMTSRMTSPEQWPTRSVTVKWYEGRIADWPLEHTEVLTEEPPYYMCQTSFSMDGKTPYTDERDGFMWSTASKTFSLRNNNSETGYVRCVRDVR